MVTGAEEVGLVAVLEVVLDVPHLVVHSDEVLLVYPASKHTLSFVLNTTFTFKFVFKNQFCY